jgi:hypothetical protein
MPVPNTNNFSLLDVTNELPGSENSLAECFLAAVNGQFDPAYEGSRNSLLNFRNFRAFVETLTITPVSRTFDANSHTLFVTVTSSTGWSAIDNASWISINSPSGGLGNGSFSVNISSNPTNTARNGTITVSTTNLSRTLFITQVGVAISTTYQVELGRSPEALNACFSPVNFYYITGDDEFFRATGLFTNSSGTIKASADYYSDGNIIRYWNGNSFSGFSSFCLAPI